MKKLPLVVSALSLVALTGVAAAHDLGLSRAEYRLEGTAIVSTLTFSGAEISLAVPGLDRDGASLSGERLTAAARDIERTIVDRIVVVGDGVRCPGRLERAALGDASAVILSARFECDERPKELGIDFGAVEVLASGHRQLAQATLGTEHAEWVASLGNRTKHLRVGAEPLRGRTASERVLPLFRMGVEHILTGYDHLLFLAGLVLAPSPASSLLLSITAFTVAHSLTLALAVLGLFGPSSRIVEPLIALSIAYVGIENRFGARFDARWRLTFLFGLVHGFGFASALHELAIARADLPLALLSFNAGVEAGQLAAIGVALALLFVARRQGVLGTAGTRTLSAALGATGLVWFAARLLGA